MDFVQAFRQIFIDRLSRPNAIGELDGVPCLLEWKTTSARLLEEPSGITALDPTTDLLLVDDRDGGRCTGRLRPEARCRGSVSPAKVSEEQRQEFASLVDDTVRRIESGLFLPHSGIRFPQNPCTTCPFLGLCLDKHDLVDANLIRKPGVDLGPFDELSY
jgi:hypothetical protein